jgi:hypothetical protein
LGLLILQGVASCFFWFLGGQWHDETSEIPGSVHGDLTNEHVFFLIEGQDTTLQEYAADAICSTWLRHVPSDNARIYADTTFPLPESCTRIGHNRTFPCHPNDATLGDSIAKAQYKREHIHLNFAQELLAANKGTSLSTGIRWIVSTEQDAWWDTTILLRYLRYLEETVDGIHDGPASGPWKLGPFLVFNRHMLQAVLGNETFMNSSREDLLSRTGPYPMFGRYEGAAYNNDHLFRWAIKKCAKSVAKCKHFNTLLCTKAQARSSEEQAAFVFDGAASTASSFPSKWIPQRIASFHHLKSHADMVIFEESAEMYHPINRKLTPTSSLRPCLIWNATDYVGG